MEENAIIYAAGYVVRVLIQKYKKGSDFVAANFVSCLTHMLEGSPLDIERDESFLMGEANEPWRLAHSATRSILAIS